MKMLKFLVAYVQWRLPADEDDAKSKRSNSVCQDNAIVCGRREKRAAYI